MAVQPGLCGTWSEAPKTGFLTTRLIKQGPANKSIVYESLIQHVFATFNAVTFYVARSCTCKAHQFDTSIVLLFLKYLNWDKRLDLLYKSTFCKY